MLVTQYFAKDLYKGKTVFVTGGGSGINLGVAKNFAALGANIAICGRTQEKLDAAAEELRALGAKVCPVAADVRDIVALQAAFARSKAELGAIGRAGLRRRRQLRGAGRQALRQRLQDGDRHRPARLLQRSRAAFDQLKETKGTIIFISAGMAYMPHEFQVHVGAAKAGIDMMMKNLALEWGHHGIRANSIVPGPIEGTEGMKRLSTPEAKATLIDAVPMRRMGTVDDIGQTAVFLASPLASYITGCVVICDGGSNLAGSGRFNAGAEQLLKAQAKE